jgi:preprotein translocase YajC subunit
MALSLPFALLALVRASNARTWVVAAVACALALYASIVTFSRIVYLAVPAILALGGLLYLRQSRRPEVGYGSLWAATVLVCAVAAAAAWLFPVAGYRGELALLGSFALMLVAAGLRPLPGASVVLSLVVVSAVTICALAVPKGAYIAYASCLLAGAVLAARTRRSVSAGVSSALMAAFVGSVAGLVAVSWHWGGDHAAMRAAPVAAVLLAWPIAAARWPRLQGPATWQWRSQAVLAAAAAVGVVAVFSGGRYMEERVNSVSQDSVGRQRHVGLLLGMLTSPDQTAFGFGLGRTPAQLAASGASDLRVGDARVLSDGEGAHLVMASGTHTQGWGEMLRVSQRIGRPASGLIRLQLRLRTDQALSVHAEVCDKHLLYDGRCKIAAVELKDVQLGWRQLELELKGSELEPGRWFAPRLTVFSLALDYLGARAEIDDLRLSDSRGQTLLDNGDFQQGMRRWFITSDRHHLPWHAKNLVAHLWFEQGLISVALVAVAMLAAVWRTGVGRSARHPLAPALAASLVGTESSLLSLAPLVLMFVVLYFIMIRPQMKKQKEHKAMIEALAKGDEVVIAGGVLGRVAKMGESYLHVEVANGVELQVQRPSIVQVLPKGTFGK